MPPFLGVPFCLAFPLPIRSVFWFLCLAGSSHGGKLVIVSGNCRRLYLPFTLLFAFSGDSDDFCSATPGGAEVGVKK